MSLNAIAVCVFQRNKYKITLKTHMTKLTYSQLLNNLQHYLEISYIAVRVFLNYLLSITYIFLIVNTQIEFFLFFFDKINIQLK